MRHKGSVSQINKERDKAIVLLFRKAKSLVQWPTKIMCICELVASLPATEFYISVENAVYYARQRYYYNNNKLFQSKYKQLLYDAFYDRFIELMNKPCHKKESIPSIVMKALDSPAPCTGLNPWQIYKVMLRHKKQLKEKKTKHS